MFQKTGKLIAALVAMTLFGLTASACASSSNEDAKLEAEFNLAVDRAMGERATPVEMTQLNELAKSVGAKYALDVEPHHGLKPKYHVTLTVAPNGQICIPVTVGPPEVVTVRTPDDLAKVKPNWQPAIRAIRAMPEVQTMNLTDSVFLVAQGNYNEKFMVNIASKALIAIRDNQPCGVGPTI